MNEMPFGTYLLPGWARILTSICKKLPVNYLGKRLTFLLRKPVFMLGQNPIDAEINGAHFRLYPDDNLSDKRLLCTPDLLDGAERGFLKEVVAPNGWLIDIGANVGGYSLLFAAERTDLKVVAVEADPEMVERLRQNVSFSGFADRFHVLWSAATEEPTTVALNRDAVNRGKNTVETIGDQSSSPDNVVKVDGVPLLDIMGEYKIDRPEIVKLDIEGYEYPVLNGFFNTAPKSRWPIYIQLEQHRKEALSSAVKLALDKGYQLLMRTRMNVILKID